LCCLGKIEALMSPGCGACGLAPLSRADTYWLSSQSGRGELKMPNSIVSCKAGARCGRFAGTTTSPAETTTSYCGHVRYGAKALRSGMLPSPGAVGTGTRPS
jgi:hypothetical protein